MTTKQIYLDRDRVAEFEPSEGDERQQFRLSPFAVPQAVTIEADQTTRTCIAFSYHGSEAGTAPRLLDDDSEIPVHVVTAVHTHKILQLLVEAAVTPFDFPGIAQRLFRAAERLPRPAERLSYVMTGAILNMIMAQETGFNPVTGKPFDERSPTPR